MENTIRILIVEDNPDDAELTKRELKKIGTPYEIQWVDSKASFLKELETRLPDVILCDYKMPDLGGPEALEIVRGRSQVIPFIVVSGTIGEDIAVEMLQAGATDYVLKDKRQRLGFAVEHALEVGRELTKRKKAEEALSASEKKYRQLFEESSDAIIIAYPQTRMFVDCNKKALEISGYSREELLSMRADQLHPEDRVNETMEAFKKQAAGMKIAVESEILTKDKKRVAVSINTSVVEIDGKLCLMGVFRDITERMKIEATQRLTQLGELVSDMAHEVNNPLMIISGNAQLCLMEDIKPPIVKENLGVIIDQCSRAKTIIERLLAFSKPSKGELKDVDINAVVDLSAKLLEHQYSLINIKIIKSYQPQLPIISIDEKQIQEVLVNIIKNAAEAMPGGGMITIVTSQEGQSLRIDITDTGEGISDEAMKKMFVPFFTTKEKGTGLGLPVCYGIIKVHGGELKFNSEVGKGTTATILLPLGGGKRDV